MRLKSLLVIASYMPVILRRKNINFSNLVSINIITKVQDSIPESKSVDHDPALCVSKYIIIFAKLGLFVNLPRCLKVYMMLISLLRIEMQI